MNTCGTCKYFGPVVDDLVPRSEDHEPLEAKYHLCEFVQQVDTFGSRKPENQTAAAVVIDGSDYYAAFCVSEEFGCIKWEKRLAERTTAL